ncbi:MAG: aminopeptidase [Phycisphaerae bacterium]|nr:aminopeptidase [Phycisphaerae bacterium]
MADPRLVKLAKVLVSYSADVKPGNLVRISGSAVAEPLIVELYRQVVLAGAHPMVYMTPDELSEILYKHGNDEQLKYIAPMTWTMVEKIDRSIGIWGSENTKALSNCDPGRMAIKSAAMKPFKDRFFERAAKGQLKWVGTQCPCESSAQDAEMSLSEYEEFVYRAGLLDQDDPAAAWAKVAQRQQRLVDYLNGKKEMRITTPQGTDVRFGLEGRTWINCCGHENFPDGEVFTGPVEDSAEGVVVYSFPAWHNDREVQDIVLRFKAGKVADASATKHEEYLIKMLDQDEGACRLGELALGTNYSITRYTKNTLFDEKIGGTFHTAVGSGYPETGSKNQSGLHWDMVCDLREGGIVMVDGETISENGRFMNLEWPGN